MEKRNKVALILEDEIPLLKAIKSKLDRSGFDTLTTRSVNQAINILEDVDMGDIDFIWTDHYLSGKETGLDFVDYIKKSNKWKHLPVFVVSVTAGPDNIQSYMDKGVERFYTKHDYRMDTIVEDIKNILEKKEQEKNPEIEKANNVASNHYKKILVTEDEPALLHVLQDKFSSEHFKVFGAVNGEEGLKIALTEHPDFILADILMPKMDGISMIREIRKDPWGKDVPIIVLSNLNDEQMVADSLQQGAFDYLIKSDWNIDDIVKKVENRIKNNIQK